MVDADTAEAELAVMLTDDAGIRTLNKNWRGIDKPTNVLSFPALQPVGARGPDDPPPMLGDIAIARYDLHVNADAARATRVTVPSDILARAKRVIGRPDSP